MQLQIYITNFYRIIGIYLQCDTTCYDRVKL
jgi:hypothetical protein